MPLETRNLTYKYSEGLSFEKTALKDINIKIEDGEFIGLIGHTGSGKSTLVQLLDGLLTPTEGTVLINGVDIFDKDSNIKEIRQKVGLVFQYPEHQLFEMTVFKDVAFGPKNQGLSTEEIKLRVQEALDMVQIPESLYEKSPFELSGGQKRRVAIAGVLSMNPEILIMDEPSAGLDFLGKTEILGQIEQLKKKKTVILISHLMEDIARLSDRIILLHKGEVAGNGSPLEIFSDSEKLTELGLAVTKSQALLISLKNRGLNIETNKLNAEDAANEIYRALKGKNTND